MFACLFVYLLIFFVSCFVCLFPLRNERVVGNVYKVLSEMFGFCEDNDCCLSLISLDNLSPF